MLPVPSSRWRQLPGRSPHPSPPALAGSRLFDVMSRVPERNVIFVAIGFQSRRETEAVVRGRAAGAAPGVCAAGAAL